MGKTKNEIIIANIINQSNDLFSILQEKITGSVKEIESIKSYTSIANGVRALSDLGRLVLAAVEIKERYDSGDYKLRNNKLKKEIEILDERTKNANEFVLNIIEPTIEVKQG